MNRNDIYYLAIRKYRNITNAYDSCKNDREELIYSNPENDYFETMKFACHIDENWIVEIEKGLPFIEKAIAEERQFIRTDGEVLPIEKIKRITRSSIEHLGKHSNFITHIRKDGNIVPDKLYMTEKLSDYAVYENRFLFLLLDYLEKFLSLRLNDIEKINSAYHSKFSIDKSYQSKLKKYNLKIEFEQEIFNNQFSIIDEKCKTAIERIKNCEQIVQSYLNTPLMSEVSKAPPIHLPIVKTNVLKMNNNFKNALALYEYIVSYKDNGYTIEEVKKNHVPYNDLFQNRIYDIIKGFAFETYVEGNNAELFYENNYLQYENYLAEQEKIRLQDKLNKLKKTAFDSDMNLEEYALLLEERNTQLVKDSEELTRTKNEVYSLNKEITKFKQTLASLQDNIDTLNKTIDKKNEEIGILNQKYNDDISSLNSQHQKEISKLKNDHDVEMYQIKQSYENVEQHAREEAEEKVQDKLQTLENQVEELDKKNKELDESYQVQLNLLNKELDAKNHEYENINNLYLELQRSSNEETTLLNSTIIGLRAKCGEIVPSEEFTSEDSFTLLENSYIAFTEFFEKQWKLTKKEIVKKVKNDLNTKKKK